jgi:hydrogenase expression/formation protein HypE
MHSFIHDIIVKKLQNGVLEKLDDSAVLENKTTKRVAMTTDSYVVNPVFFSGGDIGRMCVSGTVNDLATSGATVAGMSLAFILEDGVTFETIDRVVDSIATAAKEAGVKIVTGDTKVVEKGKGDQIYINTAAFGHIPDDVNLSTYNAKENDCVIVTGPIGNHEVSLLLDRKMVDFEADIKSDVAPLNKKIEELLKRTTDINVVKDPTRGGLASALQEIAVNSKAQVVVHEEKIPVDREVMAVCDLVGFDPLYLANEGKYVIICKDSAKDDVLEVFGSDAKVIGEINKMKDKPNVILHTLHGGIRKINMLETVQLPRIC